MKHVLIVDDETAICWALAECLRDEGFSVDVAESGERALTMLMSRRPDVVLMDVRLPGMDGLRTMQHLRDHDDRIPVIVMTAFGSLSTAVRAIDGHAFDYLIKPVDLEKVVAVVRQAVESAAIRSGDTDRNLMAPDGHHPAQESDKIIGQSTALQDVFRCIALIADSNVSVLITGESGTGKDLVANAIHRHSRRRGEFVPICIPELSESLVESELFGHTRGAFTGAERERRGLLEQADEGTAFIDEIGDVPLHVQVKLLRALETGEFRMVGGTQSGNSSFRLIAATNRNLENLVSAGTFREDLFFRLNVFRIHLPSLRERRDDIPLLAEHFLARAVQGKSPKSMSDAALNELMRRPWTGNVRELRNAIEAAAVICRGEHILPEHLPQPVGRFAGDSSDSASRTLLADQLSRSTKSWATGLLKQSGHVENLYEQFLSSAETALLEATLEHTGGNRAVAARLLGIHRETLREKMKRLNTPES